jgi:signal transduction histidine kinase
MPEDYNTSVLDVEKDRDTRETKNERLAAIGQMVTAIAHESRNSLQRIQTAVELLEMDLADSPQQLAELKRIDRAARSIRALLEEIRNYAAPIHLARENHDVSEVWQSAWFQVIGDRSADDIRFVEHIADCPLTCSVDRFRLEQVFRNLFENSLAACSLGPQIDLWCVESTYLDRASLRISICDNGSGIPETHRLKAFEPFFTTKQKGTGLGMPIVKRIVEAHGGIVTLGPNRNPGAEVIITIPRALA